MRGSEVKGEVRGNEVKGEVRGSEVKGEVRGSEVEKRGEAGRNAYSKYTNMTTYEH